MAKYRDNRVYNTRQTIRLFEDRDRKRDIVAEVARTIPWNETWSSSSHSSYTSQLFVISPTVKSITPIPPNAPIKPRKLFSKEGLKPKKLRFTDEEKDEAENEHNSEKSVDLSTMFKWKKEFLKKQGESGRLDHENLNTMLQSMRLELENKENRQYGQEQHERKASSNRSIAKERARNNNNNSSQSSKLNCSPKDKTIASCLIPEVPKTETVEEDLIENKYNCGSLVWAHMHNYPWWPAIVDDCPENLRYYELKESSIIPVKYHVTFFKDDIIQHAWLNPRSIKAFAKYKKGTIMKKNKFYKMNDKKPLEKAYTLAQSAIPLSIFERLQRFSYISRLKNMRESVSQFDEEEDNEILPTPPPKLIAPAHQAGRPAATCAIHGQPILASPKPRETPALPLTSLWPLPLPCQHRQQATRRTAARRHDSPSGVGSSEVSTLDSLDMLPRARFPYEQHRQRSAVVKECGNGAPRWGNFGKVHIPSRMLSE
ncbi:Zinc finger CW-type PWWP domain protein 1 [Acromyrmex echinatior]|uniref:Zinc finger CW-type PWWP domain protein 1 n=1 Tax=Acromyrmex echinatior TaxID=103372 RepID=F4WT38_ACREC|nr:Zinc finger CW-type PWWP domain protein 1 [Acromyrmex echinatior]